MSIIRRKKSPTDAADEETTPAVKKPAGKDVEASVSQKPTSIELGPVLRKKELFEAVVERSGLKKGDVKLVVENTLAVLGEALKDNREMNLPPLGKIKAQREKKVSGGRMVITKIRQNEGAVTTPTELPK